MEQKVVETRLGSQTISLDKIILFPRGLIGFEGEREFTLLQLREEMPFLMLQSINNPAVGLMVTDPYGFYPEYQIEIGDAEQKILAVEAREQLTVLVTVYIPPNQPENSVMNLSGPIIINHEAKVGLQVPQKEGMNPIQISLASHVK